MIKKLLSVLILLTVTGCTMVQESELLLTKAVSDYCVAPEMGRELLQKRVQTVLYPNTIKIVCANDK
jgi:hypothetical protein